MTLTDDTHTLAYWSSRTWWQEVADDLLTVSALPHRSIDDLAAVSVRLDELAAAVRETRTVIARRLAVEAQALPKQDRFAAVDGVRRVVDVSSERVTKRYDNSALAAAFGARIAEQAIADAGDEPPPPAVLGQQVAVAVASAAGALTDSFAGWRATDAAMHGVDLDRYRTVERHGRTAKVR